MAPTTAVPDQRRLIVPPGQRALLGAAIALLLAALLPLISDEYTLVLATDVLVFADRKSVV